MAKLNDARRSLQRAKESAQERLKQLDDERREIKTSLKSLDAAIKALGDADRPAKGNATKADIMELVIDVVTCRGRINATDLFAIIRERLGDNNPPRGLKLQFDRVMRDERFVFRDEEYTLRDAVSKSVGQLDAATNAERGNHE